MSLFALFLVGFGPSFGAVDERDLGSGLMYVRVHALPGDLPQKPSGRVWPCVVDVRYVEANEPAAMEFVAWLKARATLRSPVFVLANADTSSAVRSALGGFARSAGVVVVGAEARGFSPHVAVKTSAEDERKAYEALEKGATLASLLTDLPNKIRNDEASLSKDRVAEASADAGESVLAGKKTSPPIDWTLQRAVHLHRTLVALKKI